VEAIREVFAGRRYLSRKISELVVNDYISDKRGNDPLSDLSVRERQVLQLIAEGDSNLEMAKKLLLSPKTVETYRSRLMTKLGLKDVTAVVRFAIQHGLTNLDNDQ
jgi:DNA-binding NarL/FixJ family response regulator